MSFFPKYGRDRNPRLVPSAAESKAVRELVALIAASLGTTRAPSPSDSGGAISASMAAAPVAAAPVDAAPVDARRNPYFKNIRIGYSSATNFVVIRLCSKATAERHGPTATITLTVEFKELNQPRNEFSCASLELALAKLFRNATNITPHGIVKYLKTTEGMTKLNAFLSTDEDCAFNVYPSAIKSTKSIKKAEDIIFLDGTTEIDAAEAAALAAEAASREEHRRTHHEAHHEAYCSEIYRDAAARRHADRETDRQASRRACNKARREALRTDPVATFTPTSSSVGTPTPKNALAFDKKRPLPSTDGTKPRLPPQKKIIVDDDDSEPE